MPIKKLIIWRHEKYFLTPSKDRKFQPVTTEEILTRKSREKTIETTNLIKKIVETIFRLSSPPLKPETAKWAISSVALSVSKLILQDGLSVGKLGVKISPYFGKSSRQKLILFKQKMSL